MFVGYGVCSNCGNKYAELHKDGIKEGYITCECNYTRKIKFEQNKFSNNPGSMFDEDDMKLLKDIFE